MFNFFKKKKRQVRSFSGANSGRLNDFAMSFLRVDGELRTSYRTLVGRARELSKNDADVISALLTMERNVVGCHGFRIQSRSLDSSRNDVVERLWHKYSKSRAVTVNRQHNGRDFDLLILRTLLVDGEVFLHRMYRDGLPCYELIDSLDVDFMYNVEDAGNGTRISMGVRIDEYGTPISYFIRRNTNSTSYHTGDRVEVPASEVIHIYRSYFANQTRGYTMLSASLLRLNHLEGYNEAELISARMEACNQAFLERDPNSVLDVLDDNSENVENEMPKTYEPGTIRRIPDGYNLKQLQSNHPNSNFGTFIKNILRSVASSLGLSYNKAFGDYEAVNYSSLREAALEDRETWKDLQEFLIDNWKQIQFEDFATAMIAKGVTAFIDSDVEFFGRTWDWVDPLKDINAIKVKLELGLTDPITEIEKLGGDAATVIRRIAEFRKMKEEANVADNSIQ